MYFVDGSGLTGAFAGLVVVSFFKKSLAVSENFSGIDFLKYSLAPLVLVSS